MNKVVLSRKGFDDKYGGKPSIILPDGTLYSFPVPANDNDIGTPYDDIMCRGKPLTTVFHELGIRQQSKKAHLDPDINHLSLKHRPANWNAAFGQGGIAQQHLNNHQVGSGDIFLFFGTFVKVRESSKGLTFNKWMHPIHAIWGFLEVEQVITDILVIDKDPRLSYLQEHLHYKNRYENNAIYTAKSFGTFVYSDYLQLTKPGHKKSFWELPGFFKNLGISYHKQEAFCCYDPERDVVCLESASIGQEFVMQANEDIERWVAKLQHHRQGKT